jgi:hypothetical protein
MKGIGVNYLRPFQIPYHLIGFSGKGMKIVAEKTGLNLIKRTISNDYEAYHHIQRKHGFLKYPVALCLYLADKLGWGTNQEFILRKEK